MRRAALLPLLAFAFACGSADQPIATPTTTTAPTATTSAPKVEAPADPFAVEGLLREEQLPLLKGPQPTTNDVALETKPKAVPNAPASCDAFTKRAPKTKPSCADRKATLAALDAALALGTPSERDEALSALESCTTLEPGLVRGIRAELAPAECGDALVEPVLKQKPAGMTGAIQHALLGHAIAARLTRAVRNPPQLKAPFNKKRVEDFVKKELVTWYKDQVQAMEALSAQGKELGSYGKGLVGIAAGWGYLRLVESLREAPVPKEFTADRELGNEYYTALDIVLDPVKERGRDASLVGLGHMARAGLLVDERTERTRLLLSKMYGGRKVDGLDVLVLAPLPPPGDSVEARLAQKLPTYFAGLVLDPTAANDLDLLRAFARRGVPQPFRSALKEAEATLSDDVRAAYARARLDLGRRYWRAVDLDTAVGLYAKMDRSKMSENDRLSFALALALRNGPEDVAALMLKNDPMSPKFANVAALDAVAKSPNTSTRGQAAFDAAVLRQIAVPRDADAAYWEALAERYKAAVALLSSGPVKDEAAKREDAARATAKVVKTAP